MGQDGILDGSNAAAPQIEPAAVGKEKDEETLRRLEALHLTLTLNLTLTLTLTLIELAQGAA